MTNKQPATLAALQQTAVDHELCPQKATASEFALLAPELLVELAQRRAAYEQENRRGPAAARGVPARIDRARNAHLIDEVRAIAKAERKRANQAERELAKLRQKVADMPKQRRIYAGVFTLTAAGYQYLRDAADGKYPL